MEQRETIYGHTGPDIQGSQETESIASVEDHGAVASTLPITAMSTMDYSTQAQGSVAALDSSRCRTKSPVAHSLPSIIDLQKTLESSQFRHPSMANPAIRRSPTVSEIPTHNAHSQMSQAQGLPSISSFRESMAANPSQQVVPPFFEFRNPSSGANRYSLNHPGMSPMQSPSIKKEIPSSVSNAMNIHHHWQPPHMSQQEIAHVQGYPMKGTDGQVHSYQDISGMNHMQRFPVSASNLQNMAAIRHQVHAYSNAESLTHPAMPHVTESHNRQTREGLVETMQHYSNMGSIPIAHSHELMNSSRDPGIHTASAEVRAGLSEFESHMAQMSQALQKEVPTSLPDPRIAMAHHPQYRGDPASLPDLGDIYTQMAVYGPKHVSSGQQMQQVRMIPPQGHMPPHMMSQGRRFPGQPATAHSIGDPRFEDPSDSCYVQSTISESESRLQDAISVLSRMSPSVKQEPMDLQTTIPHHSPLHELHDGMNILGRNSVHVKQEPNTSDHTSLHTHMAEMNNGLSPLLEHPSGIKQEVIGSPGKMHHSTSIPPLPKVDVSDLDSTLSPSVSNSAHIGESVLEYSQASVGDHESSLRTGNNHDRKQSYLKGHNAYYSPGVVWQDFKQEVYGNINHRDDTESPDQNVDNHSSPDLTPNKLQPQQSGRTLPSFADFCKGMKGISSTNSSSLTSLTPFHQAFGHIYSMPEQPANENMQQQMSPATTPTDPSTLPSPTEKKKGPKRKRSKYLKKQSSDPEEQLPMDVHCSVKINDEIFPCFDDTLKTIMTFRMNGTQNSVADQFLSIERVQCEKLMDIGFADPVVHVYNPLTYAFETHLDFVQKYCKTVKPILFLGMNPGPFGMSQNGIPFGEAGLVKSWLAIEGEIYKPAREHPLRPVLGLQCNRSEVSGARFWGLFKKLCGTPENFFKSCFVHNYCPVAFLTKTGRNITPPQLPAAVLNKLNATCDEALIEIMKLLQTRLVVAIGKFVQQRVEIILKRNGIDTIRVETIMHPSPVNPAANKGWEEVVIRQLKKIGVMENLCLVQPLPANNLLESPTDSAQSPFLQSEDHSASSPFTQNEDSVGHSPYSQNESQSVASPYVPGDRQSVPSPYTRTDGQRESSPYSQSEPTGQWPYGQSDGQSNSVPYTQGQTQARSSPYSQSVGSMVAENLSNEPDRHSLQPIRQLSRSDSNCTDSSDKLGPSCPGSVHSEDHGAHTTTCSNSERQSPYSELLKSRSPHLQSTGMSPVAENFSKAKDSQTTPQLDNSSANIPENGSESQTVQTENHLPTTEITAPC